MIQFRKAKDSFLYNIKSEKYYDFRHNTNIIGHSHKKLTNLVKDSISSAWNLQIDSIYHRRFMKFMETNFSDKYHIKFSFSLQEFFLKLFNKFNNSKIDIIGERFKKYISYNEISINNDNNNDYNIKIYDFAEIYLNFGGNKEKINKYVEGIDKNNLAVFNYFWYPSFEININKADIVILPEIYCGNFKYVIILISKELNEFANFCEEIHSVPSLYLSSSLKNYYVAKSLEENNIKIENNDFIFADRIFSYKNISQIDNLYNKFLEKNILLNNIPPFYSYLPINLEEYQRKYVLRAFND
ncbi:MAG: hypothetical protein A2086_11420 [Spirochaetes bacterium GWD1_27_9]|nr:MAG: hypothetical protein A2Z98_14800 [Spirochaetes bacterium GWB1_27_13]OHD24497.1 MAG: hypothetical protein A2Y34_05425 [Spirochaetes bacterium GWC1_27_15]OHD35131.1 MAG: hypothetical protein A2086_11420 [Spirochaetes bacterium GWD1_27_9]